MAPFALRFVRPFVRRIHAHLAAQAANGRGEVEVVGGRVLDQHGVARRVHAGGHGPDHFGPCAHVHVFAHHHDGLGTEGIPALAFYQRG